jgi:hypothetical protein
MPAQTSGQADSRLRSYTLGRSRELTCRSSSCPSRLRVPSLLLLTISVPQGGPKCPMRLWGYVQLRCARIVSVAALVAVWKGIEAENDGPPSPLTDRLSGPSGRAEG